MTSQVMLCERCGALASLTSAPYLCGRCAALLPTLRTEVAVSAARRWGTRQARAGRSEHVHGFTLARPGLVGGILGSIISSLFLLGGVMLLFQARTGAYATSGGRIAALVLLVVALVGLALAVEAIRGARAGVIGNAVTQIIYGLMNVVAAIGLIRQSSVGDALVATVLVISSVLAAVLSFQELARRRAQ
jgi:hypothetical protein